MTLVPTDFHPATDALVALVDGELSASAQARAVAHVANCAQCAADVAAQREAKDALRGSAVPGVPSDLLGRLRALPFTTDLPVLDLDPPDLDAPDRGATPPVGADPLSPFGRGTRFRPGTPPPPRGFAMGTSAPAERRPPPAPVSTRPPSARTTTVRVVRPNVRLRRFRRGLVGVMAGFAVGVLATVAAPMETASGVGAAEPREVGVAETLPPGATAVRVGPRDGLTTVLVSAALDRPAASPSARSLFSTTGGGR